MMLPLGDIAVFECGNGEVIPCSSTCDGFQDCDTDPASGDDEICHGKTLCFCLVRHSFLQHFIEGQNRNKKLFTFMLNGDTETKRHLVSPISQHSTYQGHIINQS